MRKVTHLAMCRLNTQAVVGERNEYYVTLAELETILKETL